LENYWNTTYYFCCVWRITGIQHVIVGMMFGELLEHNMSFLLCLENYWNTTYHFCCVWRITGIEHAIVGMMFGELLEHNIIFVVFGELLEHNISFLLCLENYWNRTCHYWDDVWRITGTQYTIFVVFGELLAYNMPLLG
jgi:hypothetical protein